jgi:hypothetical protein
MVGAQRTEGSKKKLAEWVGPCNILQYADEENMLERILTGDESWVHNYQPKSKHASMQWKYTSSPSTKKF